MKVSRVLFAGPHRLGDAVLSLKFDYNLYGIDNTYIITPDVTLAKLVFLNYNIDFTNFIFISDHDIELIYPSTKKWIISGDYRDKWLYQQALKLAAIDLINADVVLIQDADTFAIKPYHSVLNGQPNLFVLSLEDHPIFGFEYGYYKTLENLIDVKYLPSRSFVSEFMPVFKDSWQELKNKLKPDFLQHILDSIPLDNNNLLWFSEYELLGSWMSLTRTVQHTLQTRLEYMQPQDLDQNLSNYFVICNKSFPNCLTLKQDNIIENFEKVFNIVNQNL